MTNVVSNGRELYNPPLGMSNLGSFILAIDTASRCGSIAVARDGRLAAVWGIDAGAKQSSVLWDDIDRMLCRLECTIHDIGAIAVARGPGAFTGLRIGLSAAAGLARGTGAALYGATTLELAARSSGQGDEVWAVLNAYRNEVYAQRLRVDADGDVVALDDPMVASPDLVFDSVGSSSARLVGDGADVYRTALEAAAARHGVVVEDVQLAGASKASTWTVVQSRPMLAAELAELVAFRIDRGMGPGPLTPCYVRASEAEVNLKAGRLAGAGSPKSA